MRKKIDCRRIEKAVEFIVDAFTGDKRKKVFLAQDGIVGVWFDHKAKSGRKANRAQDAQGVFVKALARISDAAKNFIF